MKVFKRLTPHCLSYPTNRGYVGSASVRREYEILKSEFHLKKVAPKCLYRECGCQELYTLNLHGDTELKYRIPLSGVWFQERLSFFLLLNVK